MWKGIPEWETLYAVNENGEVKNLKNNKLIKGDINNAGYARVCLYCKPRKQRFFRHRLVAELFLDNPDNLPEVNHIDGNKMNNNIENLEWCTRTSNEREARRTGLKEYKPYRVTFINGELKNYEFTSELAQELGITRRAVLNYLQGKSQGYTNYGIASIEYI